MQLCCCSVAKLCPTIWDPMDCSTPGVPVLHYLLEFAQTHARWVDDAIQTTDLELQKRKVFYILAATLSRTLLMLMTGCVTPGLNTKPLIWSWCHLGYSLCGDRAVWRLSCRMTICLLWRKCYVQFVWQALPTSLYLLVLIFYSLFWWGNWWVSEMKLYLRW